MLQDQSWLDSTNHLWKAAFYWPRQSQTKTTEIILQQPLAQDYGTNLKPISKLNILQEEGIEWS